MKSTIRYFSSALILAVVFALLIAPAQTAFARDGKNPVPLAPPVDFSKSSPADGAIDRPLVLGLSWGASSGATSYKYCVDTINNGLCDGIWQSTASTSATVTLSQQNTVFYWQVSAVNVDGETFANNSTSWSFTTGVLPAAFNKLTPANTAVNQNNSVTLTWQSATNATSYDYCYQTISSGVCASWTNNGTATSVTISSLAWDTTYYWQARARGTGGNVEANGGAWWQFKTAAVPSAFGKVGPLNGSINQPTALTLSWNASTNATGYSYCYDTTNDNACSSWLSVGNVTSTPISGLALGTTYYWQIRANSPAGSTDADANTMWAFSTLPAAPSAFNKISPASGAINQNTSLTLTWQTSTGAASYDYCYNTSQSCAGWTSAGTATSAPISGLTQGTTYYWHVRAVNAGGTTYSDANAWYSFTTAQPPAQFNKTSPANGATNIGINGVALTWQSSTGAASYDYCYDTTNDAACTAWVSAGTNTTATLNGLAKGTTYYWQVRARAGSLYTYSNLNAYWSFTTAADAGAFAKIAPANNATSQPLSLTLSWGASTGAARYEYCFDTTNDNACTSWTSAGTNLSTVVTISASTDYWWQVRAVNAVSTVYANSATWWKFSSAPPAPAAFGKINPPNAATGQATSITLTWQSSSGAASYEYCYNTSNPCVAWISAGTSTSATISGLANSTTYFWQVRANNAGGITYADTATYWSFTTQAPGATLNKISPANNATGQPTSLTLTWSTYTGATSYEYCYDKTNDNACGGSWVSNGTATSKAVSLSGGATYYWQVRAKTATTTVYADSSTWWKFTTTGGGGGGTFGKVSPTDGEMDVPFSTMLKWNTKTGTNAYFYCIDKIDNDACDTTWKKVNKDNTSVTVSKLKSDTTYYWQVYADTTKGRVYANGTSGWWSFKTGAIPAFFSKLEPSDGLRGVDPTADLTLKWTTSAHADRYAYCVDTILDDACNTGWIDVGLSTQAVISGLQPGTAYSWMVRATNDFGTMWADLAPWTFYTVDLVDDADRRLEFDDWASFDNGGATDGAYYASSLLDGKVTFTTAVTTAVTLDTYKGPDQGIAEVCIDAACQSLDLYDPAGGFASINYTGLSSAAHTVSVRVTGTLNAASTGTEIRFDGYNVNGVAYSDLSASVKFNSWSSATNGGALNGAYRTSNVTGATIRFNVSGPQFGLITAKGPAFGKVDIYVDGSLVGNFDLYSASAVWQYEILITGLADGDHVVEVRVSGSKNASSSGTGIVVDGYKKY
jgi:hypothetical protein